MRRNKINCSQIWDENHLWFHVFGRQDEARKSDLGRDIYQKKFEVAG